MFQFPGLASLAGLLGCPIRKSPDLGVLASTRSLSQLATSFIAFRCLGIPRVSFFFFFLRIAASKIVIDFLYTHVYNPSFTFLATVSSFQHVKYLCALTSSSTIIYKRARTQKSGRLLLIG